MTIALERWLDQKHPRVGSTDNDWLMVTVPKLLRRDFPGLQILLDLEIWRQPGVNVPKPGSYPAEVMLSGTAQAEQPVRLDPCHCLGLPAFCIPPMRPLTPYSSNELDTAKIGMSLSKCL